MSIWIKLTAEESHDFQIPWEIASSARYKFYSTATLSNLYFDRSWPLLSFALQEKSPEIISFQPCRVDFDFINKIDDYDPLNELLGHNISLNRRELIDLLAVLEEISHDMSVTHKRPLNTLKPLTPLQHKQFRIPWMPKDNRRERVLIQTSHPDTEATNNNAINLIILSSTQTSKFRNIFKPVTSFRYHLQICEFTKDDLLNEFFDPRQHATNNIDLDSRGIRELANVMRDFMLEDYKTDSLVSPKNIPLSANRLSLSGAHS